MSNFIVKKVAVLGAGVMGAQIAAHCVNAKVPVVLFDLPAKEGPKNGIVLRAIEGLKKLSPAPLGNKDDAACIEVANYDDGLELLKGCDLIIEAIAERMDWKHDLYKKVAPFIAPDAIFASNTSGLSITALSDGFAAELKARFCGVHFFNPPRYMHLVELIPTATTRPEILDQLEGFLVTTLGKGVVRAKDTPNFIANRVGVFNMLATIHEAEKFGLSCDLVDDLTGAKLGRAKSGTFRTADVVGLDTLGHVVKTMQDTLGDDPFAACYKTPEILTRLVAAGALGQKTGAGFYKRVGREVQRLDFASGQYVAGGGKADDLVVRILKEKDAAKRMKALRDSGNPQAQFLWAIFRDAFHYIAVHLEAVADTPCAGASARSWVRSKPGRRRAGSRSPTGSRKTSTPAKPCVRRRCRPGCSTDAAACMPPTAPGRRHARPMCRVPLSPSTAASRSAPRFWARAQPTAARAARRCSRTNRYASGIRATRC
ncbi:MAG: 3-hydroxyacyl-CoA dehydrogenase family protein [Rhodocyclales bacterium]|nr:3-hydroxyacyl-CoA dehydrogenase family protein [Rhodocyclales bacterium]